MTRAVIQSQLTTESKQSLSIHKFIYHIIEPQKDPKVSHLTEVALDQSQTEFFKTMIIESAQGTRYKFSEENGGPLARQCSRIVNDQETFLDASREIVDLFASSHDRRMADGVLVVALVSMVVNLQPQYFVCLMKIDYSKVMEQTKNAANPTRITLREIHDSLSENRSSIQKRALIDVQSIFPWDALAIERSKAGQKVDTDSAIGEHFKSFLGVKLMENDSTYTKQVVTLVSNWAKTVPGVDYIEVRAKVVNLIDAHDGQVIDVGMIRSVVCVSTDENKARMLIESFDQCIQDKGFDGLQFVSRKGSVTNNFRRTKIKTNNNVSIEFTGTKESARVDINNIGGETVITIRATNVTVEG